MSDFMDEELIEEISLEIQLLLEIGFYNDEEILEIIDDEFIEEDIPKERLLEIFSNVKNDFEFPSKDSDDFLNLKNAFLNLSKNHQILTIHNAGYDIEEGIQDSFELFTHLRNNKYEVEGFCFYSFEDIEMAIGENSLDIAFGDFEYDEEKGLEIAKTVRDELVSNGFNINWNETIDERIGIKDFNWQKVYEDREYSMDGALSDYVELNKSDD
ncbi:MAG: hypothetical protein IKV87_01410 [Methanobrevibacter sp.]|nr:hypothetical protein [Methanobrevibacter sp.]